MTEQTLYFEYGEAETEYLKSKDPRLAEVIDRIGHIERAADNDLFTSVIHHIIGQQISTKAQQTVWNRMYDSLNGVTPDGICKVSVQKLQSFGMTFRKAEYIKDFAQKVMDGAFNLNAVEHMTDEDAMASLSSLKGIGRWTAEMILLFCLQRPNILSFDDLAIRRGMAIVYRRKDIDRKFFERIRRRLSPCCSAASLYFWAAAGGAMGNRKPLKHKVKREVNQ